MIDISKWIGTHVWETVVYENTVFCVPNLTWCVNAIFLVIFVITFLICIFKLIENIT